MEGSGGTSPCIATHHIATICNDKSTAPTCRSVVVCREALTARLRKLAKQIATPGTELSQLVTQSKPR